MKDFYFLLDGDIIVDVIEYPADGYLKVSISQTSLPPGVNAGYYRLKNGTIILDQALKDQVDEENGGQDPNLPLDINAIAAELVKQELTTLDLQKQNEVIGAEMVKKDLAIYDLTMQNQVIGSMLSALELKIKASEGGISNV